MRSARGKRRAFVPCAWLLLSTGLACHQVESPRVDSSSSGGPSAAGTSAGGGGGNGASPSTTLDPGRKEPHRLNTTEYNATVQDVLGATLQPANGSWRGGELAGFDNIASVQGITDGQYARYFDAAQSLATEALASGELSRRFVVCALPDPECVKASIAAAARGLLRRPPDQDELATYQRVYDGARALGDDESAALTLVVRTLLSSAEFLYRIELDPEPSVPRAHPLGPFELASRLSYFLWSSAPDDALLRAAADGSLAAPEVLAATVDRMLNDPKSERFATSFAGQWLGARQVPAGLYQWTPRIAQAASREMVLFFSDFLHSERSWFEFPTADFNYVDSELAYLYEMPSTGAGLGEFIRVEHHQDRRAGFLGLAGFLSLGGLDRRTSPSRRGHKIAADLLCADPPPAPPNVGMLEAEVGAGGGPTLDVRARLEQHRSRPECAACHALFDPYGLALEQYDAIGRYRAGYQEGASIDPTVTLPRSSAHPEGLVVTGLEGLSRAVASDPRFGECVAKKLFTYGLGRVVTAADEPHLAEAQRAWSSGPEPPTLRRLIQVLVATEAFRSRRGGD